MLTCYASFFIIDIVYILINFIDYDVYIFYNVSNLKKLLLITSYCIYTGTLSMIHNIKVILVMLAPKKTDYCITCITHLLPAKHHINYFLNSQMNFLI